MKIKILIFSLLFVTFGYISNCQSMIGISGGYNSTNYFSTNKSPHFTGAFKSQPSYCLTAYLKGREKQCNHIGFEISYLNKLVDINASYGGLGGQTQRSVNYSLNYLYFSIYPEWTFGKEIVFNLSTGLQMGFMLNSKKAGKSSSWDILGNDTSWTDKGNASDDFIGGDLRLFLRLGLEFPLHKNLKLLLDNTYSTGIFNIGNGGFGSYGHFVNSREFNFSIGLIYIIHNLRLSKILDRFPNTQKIEVERDRQLNSKKE